MTLNQSVNTGPLQITSPAKLKRLNSSKEVAFYLNVSDVSMRQARLTDLLLGVKAPKFIKIGRTVRYKDSDIEAWLDSLDENNVGDM
ncbi:MAG: putative DNA-binding transcriptional regulator AlpA [Paraglaciecola sp.]|jgi:predicted DNA-binding transcriptional regulator AlpA